MNNDYDFVVSNAETLSGLFSLYGNTALMIALYSGHLRTAEFLVHHEAGIVEEEGRSALMVALECGHYRIARMLACEAGFFSKSGRSALFYVATQLFPESNANYELYKYLLEREPDEFFLPDYNNCLGILIEYAPNVYPPLIDAILEREGMRICNVKTSLYPLQFAAVENNQVIVDKILSKYEHNDLIIENPLHVLARENLSYSIHKYEQFMGQRDEEGKTALMVACRHRNEHVMRHLLREAGKQDKAGRTALMYACEAGFDEGIKMLLSHEHAIRDRDGLDFLCYIAMSDHYDAINEITLAKLIWKYADVSNAINVALEYSNEPMFFLLSKNDKRNLIHSAIRYNQQRAIEHYVNFDPVLDKLTHNSILQECIEYEQYKHFARFEDEICHQNRMGQTALIIFVINYEDHDKIPAYLLQETGIADYRDLFAIDYAVEGGKPSIFATIKPSEINTVNRFGKNILGRCGARALADFMPHNEIEALQGYDYFGRGEDYTTQRQPDVFGRSWRRTRRILRLVHYKYRSESQWE